MYKVGICGFFGVDGKSQDGQSVKTNILTKALISEFGEEKVATVDTYMWKKRVLKLILSSVKMIKNADNIILLPAQNGIKVFIPMFLFLNVFFKKKIHYYVVGGWLSDLLKDNKKLLKKVRRLDAVYVELHSMEKSLEEQGLSNIYYIPKFRELNLISKEDIPPIGEVPYKICTFSRVSEDKGIGIAIDAVKKVNNDRILFQLDIYGKVDLEYQNRFDDLLRSCPPYIQYKGVIDYRESNKILKNYLVMLFPTFYHGEGYPNSVVDAFSAALPVIASDWKYNSDIVRDGIDGFIFKSNSSTELEAVLEKITLKPEIIMNMKEKALERCSEYLPENAVNSIIENLA